MTAQMIHWPHTRELLTPAEMARADQAAIAAGSLGFALMEKAGEAVADMAASLVLPLSRATPRVAVLCGPGNNGGDGYVAARLLAARGFAVRCYISGEVGALKGDAATAAAAWTGPRARLSDFQAGDADLVIDALFGAGLTRDLAGDVVGVVADLNAWHRAGGLVLAVDVPSGLDGATGQVRGVAVEADATVTFFRLKPGHLMMPGRQLCGALHLAHIGIPDSALDDLAAAAFLNGPTLWRDLLPHPRVEGHKYTRGHVLVVSGPTFQTGAARLAARACARIGAGLVTMAGTPAALEQHSAQVTAIMLAACPDPSALIRILADVRKNVAVIGPGLGLDTQARALLDAVFQSDSHRALVLDADALTLMAQDAHHFTGLIKARHGAVILTPHEGEFTRLHKALSRQVESVSEHVNSKLERARWLARAMGAAVLLKGPDSIIAMPDGRASIATDLPPWLATAGSGDVLAGLIGGLLAQGMPVFEAASAAIWLHGRAARLAGPGLTADDLPAAVAPVLAGFLTG